MYEGSTHCSWCNFSLKNHVLEEWWGEHENYFRGFVFLKECISASTHSIDAFRERYVLQYVTLLPWKGWNKVHSTQGPSKAPWVKAALSVQSSSKDCLDTFEKHLLGHPLTHNNRAVCLYLLEKCDSVYGTWSLLAMSCTGDHSYIITPLLLWITTLLENKEKCSFAFCSKTPV